MSSRPLYGLRPRGLNAEWHTEGILALYRDRRGRRARVGLHGEGELEQSHLLAQRAVLLHQRGVCAQPVLVLRRERIEGLVRVRVKVRVRLGLGSGFGSGFGLGFG